MQLLDIETIGLVRRMNGLRGIVTTDSCCGHGASPFSIHFNVDPVDPSGLFLLARSADERYWKYGYLWRIDVSVGDRAPTMSEREILPIHYRLHSGPVRGDDAYQQAVSLCESIDWHLGHKVFLDHYKLAGIGQKPDAKVSSLIRRSEKKRSSS